MVAGRCRTGLGPGRATRRESNQLPLINRCRGGSLRPLARFRLSSLQLVRSLSAGLTNAESSVQDRAMDSLTNGFQGPNKSLRPFFGRVEIAYLDNP